MPKVELSKFVLTKLNQIKAKEEHKSLDSVIRTLIQKNSKYGVELKYLTDDGLNKNTLQAYQWIISKGYSGSFEDFINETIKTFFDLHFDHPYIDKRERSKLEVETLERLGEITKKYKDKEKKRSLSNEAG